MVHEWALAEAIKDYIKSHSRGRGIEKIVIKLGVLQSIDREILDFALKNLLEEEGIRAKSIVYEEEPVVLRCRRCGHVWAPDLSRTDEAIREAIHFIPEAAYSYLKCPKCGSRDFEIVSGRGLAIKEIVVGDD